jgi:hypothetical protein
MVSPPSYHSFSRIAVRALWLTLFWCRYSVVVECVAVVEDRVDEDGCADLCVVHTVEGSGGFAAGVV